MPRLAAATLLAALAATAANVLLRAVALAVLDIPDAFEPLALRAVILSTLGGVLAAGLALALLARFAREPVRAFLVLAAIALVLSLWPPLSLGFADPPEHPGTDAASVGTLVAMHLVAAAICVPALAAAWRRAPALRS